MGRVLHLAPGSRGAAAVRVVNVLADDAFEAKSTSVLEDHHAIAGEVLDIVETVARACHQPREPSLALKKRFLPIILPVQLEQVEGEQTGLVVTSVMPERVEVMRAAAIEDHGLAIKDDG